MEALLNGGGTGSSGIREKPISKAAYLNLSESEKQNPKIIWLITDDDGFDFRDTYGTEILTKGICWEAYQKLSEFDKNNPKVIWIISDKNPDDLTVLMSDNKPGSRLYAIDGTSQSSQFKRVEGVDYALNINSPNPISNMAVAKEFNDRLGGLSFRVSETGGLSIIYNKSNGDITPK